ncbi:MAG TPA: ABC transporter substrate-binding protein [Bryobacteraceae bacterium]|nr:ABC transporter substrate-binding protein [Bryobacteraceae bacterium]
MRVISLLASGTEIVCALGAGDCLVGRSHECDNPPWVRSLPSCTEPAFDVNMPSGEINREVSRRIRCGEPLYRIDTDLIQELAPDVIITQAHCDVCAVTPGDVDRSGCAAPAARILTLRAGTLNGIFDDMLEIAQALGRESQGRQLVCLEQRRLAKVRASASRRRRPAVVAIEWTDPIFAMGNWGPELIELAGGELLLGETGRYSRPITFDQIMCADPDYLIIAPCGFDLKRTASEMKILERYPGWSSLRAVAARRVALADGNLLFNRSGMTVSLTAEVIAEMLHGINFDHPTENKYWRWY